MSSGTGAPDPTPSAWTPPPGWVPTPQGWVPPEAAAGAVTPAAPAAAAFVPSEPVEYHRQFRTLPGYRHWKPIVALVLAVVYYVVLSVVVGVPIMVVAFLTGAVELDDPAALALIDAASPISLLLALGSLAVMLPAVHLAMLSVGLRPAGVRHSVVGRIRWGWMWFSALPALAIVVASIAIPMLIALAAGEQVLGEFTTEPALFAICVVIILALTPFQAAAEEYVFRGFLVQIIGSWVRFWPVAFLLPSVLFAAAHYYDLAGLVSVGIFGVAAAVVVWRTGGLEAAISYHAINNIVAFLFLASGLYGTTVNEAETASDAGEAAVVIVSSLIGSGLWVLWILWLAKRRCIARVGAAAPAAAGPAGSGGIQPAASAEHTRSIDPSSP